MTLRLAARHRADLPQEPCERWQGGAGQGMRRTRFTVDFTEDALVRTPCAHAQRLWSLRWSFHGMSGSGRTRTMEAWIRTFPSAPWHGALQPGRTSPKAACTFGTETRSRAAMSKGMSLAADEEDPDVEPYKDWKTLRRAARIQYRGGLMTEDLQGRPRRVCGAGDSPTPPHQEQGHEIHLPRFIRAAGNRGLLYPATAVKAVTPRRRHVMPTLNQDFRKLTLRRA